MSNKKKISGIVVARIIAGMVMLGGIAMIIVNSTLDDVSPALVICGSFAITIGFMVTLITLLPLLQKGLIKMNKQVILDSQQDLKDITIVQSDIASQGVKTISKAAVEGVQEALTEEKKYCKHCGKQIDADSKFCQYCGKEL